LCTKNFKKKSGTTRMIPLLFFLLLLSSAQQCDQSLYIKSYGNSSSTSILYIHGGPGYASWDFEITTAQSLADQGYFVIVYDQRGQGRSPPTSMQNYNYHAYADDIFCIIEKYNLSYKVTLLAHSHGGSIALEFDSRYPGIAKKIVLVAAPIRFFSALQAIFENSARFFYAKKDDSNVRKIAFIKRELENEYDQLSEETRISYASQTFDYAKFAKLFSVKNKTKDASILLAKLFRNPISSDSGNTTAMPGFLVNEDYIHKDRINQVHLNPSRFCGIYGDEDGLFTPVDLGMIQNALESDSLNNFALITGSSHAVFIFQQHAFFEALQSNCGVNPVM
jgi:proline iminopeptidase